MAGLIGALNTGKTGLMVSQKGIEVTGNNLTNASTEGYSRQVLKVSSSPALEHNGIIVGHGAVVTAIARQESVFVTKQLINKSGDYGEQAAMAEPLGELERIAGIADDNLVADINAYFEAWQALSNEPSGTVERQEVIQMGKNIAKTFASMDDDLNELTENINVSIAAEVDTINQMADQIAGLNLRIVSTEAGGASANGLRDDRDQLLQELSELVGINTYEGGSGMVSVQLSSGLPLVEGGIASSMSSSRVDGLTTLSLDMGATTVELGLDDFGGEIKGLMSVRDNEIPQVRDNLDRLAYTLANEVNAVHEAGVDLDGNPGVRFFSYSTSTAADAEAWTGAAATLAVAITQTDQVAAGATSSSGDNTNTLAMVALQDAEVVDGSTFNEFYSKIASKVGLAVDQNTYELETAQDALVQVQNMRDSAVGVSTDEELLLLTQYQTGYRAAAQYINAINEMLDTMLTMGA